MGKIIAVVNQKGGVGKTTTAVNLAAALSAAEKRVLLMDFDPQGNATTGFGLSKGKSDFTSYDFLIQRCRLEHAVHKPFPPFLSVMISTSDLTGAEIEMAGQPQRETLLKQVLRPAAEQFDVVLIDCPPSLGLLTVNALVAAHSVLIPLQCEFYALEGLSQLMKTVEITRKRLNPDLNIEGILLTMFDRRNNLSQQVADEVRSFFGSKVYNTVIPRNVRVSEAPSFGKPVLWYDLRCPGSVAYISLAQEYMEANMQVDGAGEVIPSCV